MLTLAWFFPKHDPEHDGQGQTEPNRSRLRRTRAVSNAHDPRPRSATPTRTFSLRSLLPERRPSSSRRGAPSPLVAPTASEPGPSRISASSPMTSTASVRARSPLASSGDGTDHDGIAAAAALPRPRRAHPASAPASLHRTPSTSSLRRTASIPPASTSATSPRVVRFAPSAGIPPAFLAAGLPLHALRGAAQHRTPTLTRPVAHVAEYVAEVGEWTTEEAPPAQLVVVAAPAPLSVGGGAVRRGRRTSTTLGRRHVRPVGRARSRSRSRARGRRHHRRRTSLQFAGRRRRFAPRASASSGP